MKKLILLAFISIATSATAAEGWTQYKMNNILRACYEKSKNSPPATVKSQDYGCGCFVKKVSQNVTFEDLRGKKEHSKYIDYLIEEANSQCGSNYSF